MLKLSSSSPPPPERNSWGDQPVERELGGCSHHPRLGRGSSSFSLSGLRSVVLEYPPLSVSRGAALCFSRSAHAATRCSPWGNTCCNPRYGCCKRISGSDVAVKTESNRQWVLTTCGSLPQDHGISNSVVRLGFPTGGEIPQLYGLHKARRVNTRVRAAQQYLYIVSAQAVLLLPTTT